jgi:hypothetical protein
MAVCHGRSRRSRDAWTRREGRGGAYARCSHVPMLYPFTRRSRACRKGSHGRGIRADVPRELGSAAEELNRFAAKETGT